MGNRSMDLQAQGTMSVDTAAATLVVEVVEVVKGSSTRPLEFANVWLDDPAVPPTDPDPAAVSWILRNNGVVTMMSDAHGMSRFERVRPGSHVIRAVALGYDGQRDTTVVLRGGDSRGVRLVFRRAWHLEP